jgi:hypothetical protein
MILPWFLCGADNPLHLKWISWWRCILCILVAVGCCYVGLLFVVRVSLNLKFLYQVSGS